MSSIAEIHAQTNARINERNLPSHILQPYIDVRAVQTKYSYFPVVDPRKPNRVPLISQPAYNVSSVFNPGNTQSPWSGYSPNTESVLRNQVFALQKCSQSEYVPSSSSDLYKIPPLSKQEGGDGSMAHSLLFHRDYFAPSDPNPNNKIVGIGLFNNNTRVQLRECTKQTCD